MIGKRGGKAKDARERLQTDLAGGTSGSSASGRAAPLVVAAVLLVLSGIAWLLIGGSRAEPVSGRGPARPAAADPGPEPAGGGGTQLAAPEGRTAPEGARGSDVEAAGPARTAREPDLSLASGADAGSRDPQRFEGRGSVRGMLQVPADQAAPAEAYLLLRPSRVAPGAERAVERSLPVAGSSLEFEVEDLPLGGYDVSATAPGWNGNWQTIVLDRANPSTYVLVDLEPAGSIEGYLVDANDVPVEGMALWLQPEPEGPPRETTSDALGRFVFESVEDGPYRLVVGHPESPLLPPRSLRMRAPRLTVPRLELPALSRLTVVVLGPDGIELPGASVLGTGTGGGRIEGVTNSRGRLVVPNLPAGNFRIRATLEGVGSNRIRFELYPDRDDEVVIRLE